MSGKDERPRSVIAKDRDFLYVYNDQEQDFERRVAERMLDQAHIFRTESENQYFNRLLTVAVTRYKELYEECLTNVLYAEDLECSRQYVESVMRAMSTRIEYVRWATGRMSRWERFKRWIRNVW